MSHKIVVLDGYNLNPGDLSWGRLEQLAPVVVYDRTAPHEVVERAADATIVLTNKAPLDGETLRALPRLRYVGVLATGYNIIDVETAKRLSIPVANIPTYGTDSVAQYVFALLLELCHHVGLHSGDARAGGWAKSPDWSYTLTPLTELAGKTMGIVGFGRIGRRTARIADAFGMRVLAHDAVSSTAPAYDGFRWAGLEELLGASDVVSLHCPLTPETHGLMDERRLRLMKPSSFLINTSRGPLVVDRDLADALNQGRLAGAALDVLSIEPPPPDHPLFQARNCIVTPHMAWATLEARGRLMEIAAENVQAFLAGNPVNVVNA